MENTQHDNTTIEIMTTNPTKNLSIEELHHFDVALQLAEQGLCDNEVPVGCVLIFADNIIGQGMNEVNKTKNPTRHAEFVAFEEAEKWCEANNMNFAEVMMKTSMYVSLEPCIMCASALYQLRIERIFFGACNPRFGGILSVASNTIYGHDHEIDIIPEIDIERSINLLRRFYQRENPFAPEEKRKIKSSSLT